MTAIVNGGTHNHYVLVTAAYNEEAFIERLLCSVTSQTIPPTRWIIVSDGSTDGTDRIVKRYAEQFTFIQLEHIKEKHSHSFAAQVHAINVGLTLLKNNVQALFVGNLDADVSFEPDYFAELLDRFHREPELGLTGGWIHEAEAGVFKVRKGNSPRSVPHAVQLFRRECLDALGWGYQPFPYGGPDWYAEVSLRMKGWRVRSCPDLKVLHHRLTGSANGLLRAAYREGLMHYSMGSHPLYECFRAGHRLSRRPVVVGALVRLLSFVVAACRKEQKYVSAEFIRFLRSEELERVWSFLRGGSATF